MTLHHASISASGATALALPCYTSEGDNDFPFPVTINVEDANSLTTNGKFNYALYGINDTTFTGTGSLSLTNSAADACYAFYNKGAFSIDSSTQVTISGGKNSQIVGNLAVTGSGSKLTIADGAKLTIGITGYGIDPNAPTVTVEDGATLENNGTLDMEKRDKEHPCINGEISGSGTFKFGMDATLYRLINGEYILDGGDVSESGLNLDESPATATYYTADSRYIVWNPTAKTVTLHNARINTTSDNACTFTYTKGIMNGSWVFENNGHEHNDAAQSIYGNVTLSGDKSMGSSSQDAGLTVTAGATLTIDSGVTLTIEDSMPITNKRQPSRR